MKVKVTGKLILAILLFGIIILIALGVLLGQLLKTLDSKWLIVIMVLIIIGALIYEIAEKKKNARKKAAFLEVGKYIFPGFEEEFSSFYHLYLNNCKKFITQNGDLLKDAESFDLKNLEPIAVTYLFANAKNLMHEVDWKGEEIENETEEFIDNLLKQKPAWVNTSKLRASVAEDKQRDGKFIINLLKAVDKDLRTVDRRLIFFELGWDAYVFTVVTSNAFDAIKRKLLNHFHGVEKLR